MSALAHDSFADAAAVLAFDRANAPALADALCST